MSSGNGDGRLIDSSIARQFDRLPPHSVEAEMCVLGSMMMDVSREVPGQVVQLLNEESFFQADHGIIFKVLAQLYEQNRPLDAMIVREELIKRQLLEEVGGIEYLAAILSSTPNAASGAHYAGIVREKALLRQLIAASSDVLREAYSPHQSATEVLEIAERKIFEIAEREEPSRTRTIGDLAHLVYEMAEGKAMRGLDTGFFGLDDLTLGLHRGEMIVVAGRPSMGKSALCGNILENVAASRIPCAIFSLEMSSQQLAQRMLCSHAQIDAHKLRKGMLQSHEYAQLAKVVGEMNTWPLFVEDDTTLTTIGFLAKARRLVRRHQVELIVVDYLQYMVGGASQANGRSLDRQAQVSDISRAVKAAARELDIPVIAVCSLNRAAESREGNRPRMSDLRESGSIESDADTVMLIYRDDYYRKDDPDFIPDNIAEVIIAKQRHGPTGTVKLTFLNKTTRFENLSAAADPF